MSRSTGIAARIAFCLVALTSFAHASGANRVVVAVDLDPTQPGFQTTLVVRPGTTRIENVGIWIFDPSASAMMRGIGHVGGLNRGISFGHVPGVGNSGNVTAITGSLGAPVVASHAAFLNGGVEPMFAGPEVQYFESGPLGVIPANPVAPIMIVSIDLEGTRPGDTFSFHLGDMTAAWLEAGNVFAGGAFSTTGLDSLDAGGDVVPDGTDSVFGMDGDVPVPSPPAPFEVDYIDSMGGGGATVIVAAAGVPALSTWAMLIMTAAMLAAGVIAVRQRVPARA